MLGLRRLDLATDAATSLGCCELRVIMFSSLPALGERLNSRNISQLKPYQFMKCERVLGESVAGAEVLTKESYGGSNAGLQPYRAATTEEQTKLIFVANLKTNMKPL